MRELVELLNDEDATVKYEGLKALVNLVDFVPDEIRHAQVLY
jgi:hypothetical protein